MNIVVKGLTKYYNEKKVLDIDSLDISKGKITGIVGPNGAGKSTLIRIISGLDKDYSGKVFYDGQKLNDKIYNNMTLVFQKPYLFRRSVYDNIAYPLKIRKSNKNVINDRVLKVIKNLEVDDLKDKRGDKLSGGESQKVSLARALVFNPDLILLDEPTSNIDPKSLEVMEREILNYSRDKNGTVIIITHNLDQAKRICDDTIYLEDGRVK